MGFFARIRFLLAFLKLVKDPTQTEQVFKLSEGVDPNSAPIQEVLNFVKKDPAARRYFDQPSYKRLSWDELEKCPAGSLGEGYLRYLRDNKLDLDFFPDAQRENDFELFKFRMRQTHDLWHVVTGFTTSEIDELALQAFVLAQTGNSLSSVLLGGGLLRSAQMPVPNKLHLMDQLVRGWQMGRSAASLFPYDWSGNLHKSLAQVRLELGIQ